MVAVARTKNNMTRLGSSGVARGLPDFLQINVNTLISRCINKETHITSMYISVCLCIYTHTHVYVCVINKYIYIYRERIHASTWLVLHLPDGELAKVWPEPGR